MFDPNEAIYLLAIYDLDDRGVEPIMNFKTFDDKIMKCGKWVDSVNENNKKGYKCIPTLTITYTFDSIFDKDLNQHIFSFVVTQPQKFFNSRNFDEQDIHSLSNSLSVLLSIYAEDDDDKYAEELLELLKTQTSYEYMITESHIGLEIEDANIVPFFKHSPYWVGTHVHEKGALDG